MDKKSSLIVAALLLFAVLAGIGFALTPPPPPPPPVPQNIGIYDTSIDWLITNATFQIACRLCHQTTGTNISGGYNNTIGGVPTRHHSMVANGVTNPFTGTPFGCSDCHPSTPGVGNGILLDRSCTDCHNGTSFWGNSIGAHVGNFSRPHHVNTSYDSAKIGTPAANRTCNFCHGSFVDNYNDGHYIPSYGTSLFITPFATFKNTSNIQNNVTIGGNKTWGGCESCHEGQNQSLDTTVKIKKDVCTTWEFTISSNSSTPTPTPTCTPTCTPTPTCDEAPISFTNDTHHKDILGFSRFGGSTPFQNASTTFTDSVGSTNPCAVCHVIDYTNSTEHGSNFPLRINITSDFGENLINAMEVRNSTIEQNNPVFDPGTTNVTINGTGCEKCHSVKSIHNIQFNYSQNGPQGFGHINNNTDCYGCHDEWTPADTWTPGALIPTVDSIVPSVIAAGTATTLTITGSNFVNPDGNYTSVVAVDGVTYTPSSETSTQITVNIPAIPAGVHMLQLVKGGDTFSKLFTLTVVSSPNILSVSLNKGILTITGTGFGSKPINANMYVSVNHAGNQIISTSVSKWSDTQIIAKNSAAVSGDIVTVLTANSGEAIQKIQ